MRCAREAGIRRWHCRDYNVAAVVISLLFFAGSAIGIPEPGVAQSIDAESLEAAGLRSLCLCAAAPLYLNMTPAWFFGLPGATPAELAVNVTSKSTFAFAEMCHASRDKWADPREVAGVFTTHLNIGWTPQLGPENGVVCRLFTRAMCRLGWAWAPPGVVTRPHQTEIRGGGNLIVPAAAPRMIFAEGRVFQMWQNTKMPPPDMFAPGQFMHNRFPFPEILSDKGRMYGTLVDFVSTRADPTACSRSLNEIVPVTYRMYNESECRAFYKVIQEQSEYATACLSEDLGAETCSIITDKEEPWWIIKDTAQGMGGGMDILIPSQHMGPYASYRDLRGALSTHPFFKFHGPDSSQCARLAMDDANLGNYFRQRHIAQAYERDPLLLRGYKFNVRTYALVVNLPPFMAFFHRGPVELARNRYRKHTPGDLAGHISSLYVPKNKDTGREQGSGKDGDDESQGKKGKLGQVVHLTMDEVGEELEAAEVTPPGWLNLTLIPTIKRSMVLSLRAYQSAFPRSLKLAEAVRMKVEPMSGAFRIMTFDYLIDQDLGIWLMEVNENPAVGPTANPEVFTSTATVLAKLGEKITQPGGYEWPSDPPRPGDDWGLGTLQPLIWAGDKWQYGTLPGCE